MKTDVHMIVTHDITIMIFILSSVLLQITVYQGLQK